jgi:hypothetical protein
MPTGITPMKGGGKMKKELRSALKELNGLIFRGLKEDNPDSKMTTAMLILLQLGQIDAMVEKVCSE